MRSAIDKDRRRKMSSMRRAAFFVPLFLTTQLEGIFPALHGRIAFNLVDGAIRMAIFLGFLYMISRWQDIRRVFEYHGAEHKVVFNFESGKPVTVDNALYIRDYAKCVLCYKCVQACGPDHQNTFAIAVAGRGFDAHISTELAVPLPDSACVYCGNCIAVCPTGALMAKDEFDMRAAGSWNEPAQTVTDTICPYCGVGCTLTLHVQDGDIVKATSPLENAITLGNLCVKGRFGWRFVQNRSGAPAPAANPLRTT